jgi:HEPN domain-containing protein
LTNLTLAQSYLVKATKRLKVLEVLLAEESYSDVVREAQELVELALKGMLRQLGVEPPKWHDVGQTLLERRDRFPPAVASQMDDMAAISAWLRKEREFSFYGDLDVIPTEAYSEADGRRALEDARRVVAAARLFIPLPAGKK